MMQSERGEGGGSEEMRQNQRLQPLQGDQQQQQPPPQPQKCPRCDSFNTKFCYYNNYSLSQPRYFCKTCSRYWTQGGTQRNVPVGGGCRKGKRTKTTSSGENSGSSQPNQPPPPQNFTAPQTMSTASSATSTSPAVMRTNESGVPSMGSYYPGGGFLSSLAAIQSLQPPPPQPFNRPVSLGGDLGGSSNLGLLQGFNVNVPSFGSNLQINQQRQFYQMGADREKSSTLGLMYPSDQHESLMMQSSRPAPPSSSQHNWHQNFINNNNPNVSDHSTMWSTGSNNNNTTTPAGSSSTTSLNPNPWPRLPGYGAPP